MKSFRASMPFAFGIGALALLLGGCNIKWQVVNDPYAYYHRIEQRIQIQLNQIDADVQNGSLYGPMAQVLTENDVMIRQLAWHYQGGQSVDLTLRQANYLDSLLNDNAAAINDAIMRRDQWAQAFEGNWNFSYDTFQDRLLFVAYLHYQLDRQQAMVDDATQSGLLTPSQSQDMKTRIQVIRNSETGCYNLNGRLDLTASQINRLQQMADDNNRYLRFRTHRQGGRWKGDQYGGWSGQKKQYSENPWLNNKPAEDNSNQGQTNRARYWDGRPFQRQALVPTPLPVAPAPTATLVPFHAAVPTYTARPIAAAPTSTPLPTAASQNHWVHPGHPGHPNHPGHPGIARNPQGGPSTIDNGTKGNSSQTAAAPTSTSQPVAATPVSTPVPQQAASAPTPVPAITPSISSTPTAVADQSDNSDQSDQSDHPGHPGHPDHPGHPSHPGNGGNNGNSQDQGN